MTLLNDIPIDILGQIKRKLRIQQIRKLRPIPQINPLPMDKLARLLLLVHAVALNDPVVPLRSGDGTAQPDLFVRGLFV